MGKTVANKVEIRRLMALFDQKMAREVSLPLFIEKGIKRFIGSSSPNSNLIRQAKQQARFYLEMIEKLIHERKWLAGQSLSYADLTAAAHLSVVDYLGDVPWDDFEDAKVWYMTLKSRPSFRGLLKDQIPGIKKATHYDQLDF